MIVKIIKSLINRNIICCPYSSLKLVNVDYIFFIRIQTKNRIIVNKQLIINLNYQIEKKIYIIKFFSTIYSTNCI